MVCFSFRKLWNLFSFDLVFLCNLLVSRCYPEDIFVSFLWYLAGQNKSSYALRLNQWDWVEEWSSNRYIYAWKFAWLKILWDFFPKHHRCISWEIQRSVLCTSNESSLMLVDRAYIHFLVILLFLSEIYYLLPSKFSDWKNDKKLWCDSLISCQANASNWPLC